MALKKKLFILMECVFSLFLAAGCSLDSINPAPGATLTIDHQKTDVPYVLKIDGDEVSLDEYSYYFFSSKYYFDYGDETFWDSEDSAQQLERLKAETVNSLIQSHLIEKKAIEFGYQLTADDLDFIDESINSQIEELGGERAYKKTLVEKHLTDDVFRQQWKISLYYDYLYSHYFDEGGIYYDPATADQGNSTKSAISEVPANTSDSAVSSGSVISSDSAISGESISTQDSAESDTANKIKEANYKILDSILNDMASQVNVEYGSLYEQITVKTLS